MHTEDTAMITVSNMSLRGCRKMTGTSVKEQYDAICCGGTWNLMSDEECGKSAEVSGECCMLRCDKCDGRFLTG